MMQEMISRAARVAILADSSKFGRRLFAQVSELGSADYLITDADAAARPAGRPRRERGRADHAGGGVAARHRSSRAATGSRASTIPRRCQV